MAADDMLHLDLRSLSEILNREVKVKGFVIPGISTFPSFQISKTPDVQLASHVVKRTNHPGWKKMKLLNEFGITDTFCQSFLICLLYYEHAQAKAIKLGLAFRRIESKEIEHV